jgi:hypothetical protein
MLLASKIFSKIVTLHNFQINILNIGWNIIENQIGINPLIKKDISVAATASATPSRTRYLLDIVQTGIHLLDSYLIDIFAVVKCHLLKISSLRHVRDSKLIKCLLLLMPS